MLIYQKKYVVLKEILREFPTLCYLRYYTYYKFNFFFHLKQIFYKKTLFFYQYIKLYFYDLDIFAFYLLHKKTCFLF